MMSAQGTPSQNLDALTQAVEIARGASKLPPIVQLDAPSPKYLTKEVLRINTASPSKGDWKETEHSPVSSPSVAFSPVTKYTSELGKMNISEPERMISDLRKKRPNGEGLARVPFSPLVDAEVSDKRQKTPSGTPPCSPLRENKDPSVIRLQISRNYHSASDAVEEHFTRCLGEDAQPSSISSSSISSSSTSNPTFSTQQPTSLPSQQQ